MTKPGARAPAQGGSEEHALASAEADINEALTSSEEGLSGRGFVRFLLLSLTLERRVSETVTPMRPSEKLLPLGCLQHIWAR
jgi:hypothetical protein